MQLCLQTVKGFFLISNSLFFEVSLLTNIFNSSHCSRTLFNEFFREYQQIFACFKIFWSFSSYRFYGTLWKKMLPLTAFFKKIINSKSFDIYLQIFMHFCAKDDTCCLLIGHEETKNVAAWDPCYSVWLSSAQLCIQIVGMVLT